MQPDENTTRTATLERDGYLAGVPCWVDSPQPDLDAAVRFYGGIFGWECVKVPDAPTPYYVARLRGRDVAGLATPGPGEPSAPVWQTYIAVDSADATARKVSACAGRVIAPPMDVGAAGRMAVCADPAGATFNLWQAGQHKGAQLVNEPGTWNWSNLNTSQIDGSLQFYAAVLNWQSQLADFGSGPSWMLRVPGYAEFLERRNPGLRERHRAAGAPEGFTDAIAWLQPLGDAAATPPHWSVTFSVADADAVVRQGLALGGQVMVEPMEVPYARVAVLRDPWGATFTVSQFKPPA